MPQSAEKSLEEILRGFRGSVSASQGFNFVAELAHRIAVEGRKFYVGPTDASGLDHLHTGKTSYSSTAPSITIRNPSNSPSGDAVIPLFIVFVQSGTVAGTGPVKILAELSADRYSSGGTVLKAVSSRRQTNRTPDFEVRLDPTLDSGYYSRADGLATSADPEPAEGAYQQYIWTPTSVMDILDPGDAMNFWVYSAGAPGPQFFYTIALAQVPQGYLV